MLTFVSASLFNTLFNTGEPQLATPSSYVYLNLRCIVYLNKRHFTNQSFLWLATSSNVRSLK